MQKLNETKKTLKKQNMRYSEIDDGIKDNVIFLFILWFEKI